VLTFEERLDRHRMAMPETEVGLEPCDHGARFHARLELAAHCETLVRREPAEVSGALSVFAWMLSRQA